MISQDLHARLVRGDVTPWGNIREQVELERFQDHEGMKSQFTVSPSHTLEMNCEHYSYQLYREWAQGNKRAAADGKPLPLAASAANRENDLINQSVA